MAYEKITGTFESSNGTDNCAYYIYVPAALTNGGYKGIIFFPHTDISSAVTTISATETASDQTTISAFLPKRTAGVIL